MASLYADLKKNGIEFKKDEQQAASKVRQVYLNTADGDDAINFVRMNSLNNNNNNKGQLDIADDDKTGRRRSGKSNSVVAQGTTSN